MIRKFLLASVAATLVTGASADYLVPPPPPPPPPVVAMYPPPPGPGPLLAGPPPFHFAIHNGSLMKVQPFGTHRILISYEMPRPDLITVGIVPGTKLVSAQWRGDVLVGSAYVFAGRCGAIPYAVSGSMGPDRVLTLVGPAPVVDPWTCRVVGLAFGPNATLVFIPAEPPLPPPGAFPPLELPPK